MIRAILAVFRKEIIDNLRDRQSVFYALLFGPVLLPLLVAGSLLGGLKQAEIDFERVTELAVVNAASAPNLLAFLREHNIDGVDAPANFRELLRSGELQTVLEIPTAFAPALREGRPAPLQLYVNAADKDSTKSGRRITSLLGLYERTLNHLRMQARGLDPQVFDAVSLATTDVSPDGGERQMLSALLPFLLIMSMVMGGFYLAIDTTAGERERNSLEPLLSLPLPRRAIVTGKYAATLMFVALSGLLTALGIYLIFRLFPNDALNSMLRLDGRAIARAALLASPLTLLITSLLIAVSAFTRSSKEAQTYLGLLMVIPMAPFFLLQFVTLRSVSTVMLLPMLSQYKLLERVTLGKSIAGFDIALSVLGTLVAAALLLWLAFRLYERDRILT